MKMKIEYLFFLLFYIMGCRSDGKQLDTPTTGSISISVDEALLPVIESEVHTFNSLYRYAKINAVYTTEVESFRNLLDDSSRLIIVTRKLNENEIKYFEKKKLYPKTTKIATDALALITHKENPDSVITIDQLKNIFKGTLSEWKQINPNSALSGIQVIFDNKSSGTARYIKEILNKNNSTLPSNCYALNTNPEVIDYITKNKNAIGLIGVNWVSDGDDPASKGFLKNITVMAISSSDTADTASNFYKPYQAHVALKQYPLCREVFIISREARAGLGTGFAAFIAGDKGQRIILKSGLIPATMPVRILGFNEN